MAEPARGGRPERTGPAPAGRARGGPRVLAVWAAVCAIAIAGEPAPPTAPEGTSSLHGMWEGERFWARLKPPDRRFGGKRVIELVRVPPPPARLGGAVLGDVPFILVDDALRVFAWNDRTTLSQAQWSQAGYAITREVHAADDPGRAAADQRAIPGGPGWDAHLAPVLLAFAWRPDAAAAVRAIDLFGGGPGELRISWEGDAVRIGAAEHRIEAEGGRLKRLRRTDGGAQATPVLEVAGWIAEQAPP